MADKVGVGMRYNRPTEINNRNHDIGKQTPERKAEGFLSMHRGYHRVKRVHSSMYVGMCCSSRKG